MKKYSKKLVKLLHGIVFILFFLLLVFDSSAKKECKGKGYESGGYFLLDGGNKCYNIVDGKFKFD